MSMRIICLMAVPMVIGAQQVEACCLWPFFPGYAAGYGAPAWGGYGGVGYPATYGYAPAYGGNCGSCGSCNTGCCGTNGGYVGYYGGSAGCCGTGCDNCNAQPFSSSKPSPDPAFDRRDDVDDRDRDRDRDDRDRTFRRSDDRRPPYDDTRSDDFNSSSGRDRTDDPMDRDLLDRDLLDRDLQDRGADWEPSDGLRDDRSGTFDRGRSFGTENNGSGSGSGSGSSSGNSDFRDLDRGLPDFDNPDFGTRRPVIDEPEPGAATEPMEEPVIDQSVRKPPMTAPVEEEAPAETDTLDDSRTDENSTPEPSATDSAAPGDSSATSEKESSEEAKDDEVGDFLPPEDADTALRVLRLAGRDLRTNHADGRRAERLAGRPAIHTISARKVHQISSSHRQELPARWISIPMPAGRSRL